MSAIGRGGFLWVAAGLTCLAVGMHLVLDGDCWNIWGGGILSRITSCRMVACLRRGAW